MEQRTEAQFGDLYPIPPVRQKQICPEHILYRETVSSSISQHSPGTCRVLNTLKSFQHKQIKAHSGSFRHSAFPLRQGLRSEKKSLYLEIFADSVATERLQGQPSMSGGNAASSMHGRGLRVITQARGGRTPGKEIFHSARLRQYYSSPTALEVRCDLDTLAITSFCRTNVYRPVSHPCPLSPLLTFPGRTHAYGPGPVVTWLSRVPLTNVHDED